MMKPVVLTLDLPLMHHTIGLPATATFSGSTLSLRYARVLFHAENPDRLEQTQYADASAFAVYSGLSKLTATWLWAARL